MSDPKYSTGDPVIGEELRQFFLGLLADGEAMLRYQTATERTRLIEERISGESEAVVEAQRLLREGSLQEIEDHIRAVTNSPTGAIMMWVVWPPMRWPF